MKICFVGIHNRPGKTPLDSSTRTGKVIDRIIQACGDGFEFEKRNFFDMDRMPTNSEVNGCINFVIDDNVFYVGLGAVVRVYLAPLCESNFISVHHPSYAIRKGETEKYIKEVVSKIKINDHEQNPMD